MNNPAGAIVASPDRADEDICPYLSRGRRYRSYAAASFSAAELRASASF